MGTVHNLRPVALAGAIPDDPEVAPRRRVLIRAAMRIRGSEPVYPITVKEISSTGMKASTAVALFVGTRIEVELPNIGWLAGEVVRTEDQGSIGIRFGAVIDPDQTQVRVTGSYGPGPSSKAAPLRPVTL